MFDCKLERADRTKCAFHEAGSESDKRIWHYEETCLISFSSRVNRWEYIPLSVNLLSGTGAWRQTHQPSITCASPTKSRVWGLCYRPHQRSTLLFSFLIPQAWIIEQTRSDYVTWLCQELEAEQSFHWTCFGGTGTEDIRFSWMSTRASVR